MKLLSLLAAAACIGGVAQARPVILEESGRITNPDSASEIFGWQVAMDGDFAVGIGYRNIPDPSGNDDTLRTLYLFRLVNGSWIYVRTLVQSTASNEGDGVESHGVDMRDGVIAAALQPLYIFERSGNDYVQTAVIQTGDFRGDDVYIDGNRILFGGACYGATAYVRLSNGTWGSEGFLPGDFCGSTDGASGGPVALAGQTAVVSNPYNEEQLPGPAFTVFSNIGGQWTQTQREVVPEGHGVGQVALLTNINTAGYLFVTGAPHFATAIYRETEDRIWRRDFRTLHSPGDWMSGNSFSGLYPHGASVEATPDFVMRHTWDHDLGRDVVQVFTPGLNNYEHVATLVSSDGGVFTGRISISGRRVMLGGGYYFDLPQNLTAPALIQDTFPGTTAPGWTILPGSQFSLATTGNTRVFRQSSTAGGAGAVLNAADWTNQSIQADVRPTAVNGSNRWVGLATRRTDAANYYYATLRSSGILELKRMHQGSFQTLASATVPFVLNRNYRLRLESAGTLHRVSVDGVRVLQASDGDLTHGRAALLSYKAAADYDNVIVSPSPTVTMYAQDTDQVCEPPCPNRGPWIYNGGRWLWQGGGSNGILSQTSLTASARAFAGAVTENVDMAVEVRARLRAFGSGNDPWFGILTRGDAADARYTYLSLRRSNTVTLRKVDAGGQITQLGAAVFNVTPGVWYRLRLETVGTRVRGYIDGRLVLEAVDTQVSVGNAGMVTYHTQADFDDFRATVP